METETAAVPRKRSRNGNARPPVSACAAFPQSQPSTCDPLLTHPKLVVRYITRANQRYEVRTRLYQCHHSHQVEPKALPLPSGEGSSPRTRNVWWPTLTR